MNDEKTLDERTLDLINRWTLEEVEIVELHAGYSEGESPEPDPDSVEGTLSIVDIESNAELGAIRFRFKATASLAGRHASVEVAPVYRLNDVDASTIDDDILTNFVNKAAGMHAVPYLRAEMADITRRVFGSPLTLPMVALNDLEFERIESD